MPIIWRWWSTLLARSSGWKRSFMECLIFWHSGHSATYSATTRCGIWYPGYFLQSLRYVRLMSSWSFVTDSKCFLDGISSEYAQCCFLCVDDVGLVALMHARHEVRHGSACRVACALWLVLLKQRWAVDSGDRCRRRTSGHWYNPRMPYTCVFWVALFLVCIPLKGCIWEFASLPIWYRTEPHP